MRTHDDQFDKEAFFDGIVASLHESGTLRPYDIPKGTDRGRAPSALEVILGSDAAADILPPHLLQSDRRYGIVRNVGDVPYHGLTTEYMRGDGGSEGVLDPDFKPSRADVAQKFASLHKAVNRYMPDQAFATYLDYFCDHLQLPAHHAAMEKSMETLYGQTKGRYDSADGEGFVDKLTHYKGNPLRDEISIQPVTCRMKQYPDLVTAMVIYHAAHRAYLDDLWSAVKQSDMLSEEERALAIGVLDSGEFQNFHSFLLFQTMLPLTLHFYQNPGANGCPIHAKSTQAAGATKINKAPPVDHDRMKQAIGKAWEVFFAREVLTHQYRADGTTTMDDTETAAKMVCPAISHLRAAESDHSLERIYDKVIANSRSASRRETVRQMRDISQRLDGVRL